MSNQNGERRKGRTRGPKPLKFILPPPLKLILIPENLTLPPPPKIVGVTDDLFKKKRLMK